MSEAFNEAIELGGLVPTLLDFERLPGRYRLALREPALLFEQTHAVMQLAAGRKVQGMAALDEGTEAEAAQKAARYFVRMVMLRPGADHYALLGLKTVFEPAALRDHYRLMIRLTHPDFSTPGEEWPADAASRINLANDVLGSSVKRSAYDAKLLAEKAASGPAAPQFNTQPQRKAPVPVGPSPVARRVPAHGGRPAAAAGGWSHRSKVVLAACGAVACVFGLMLVTPPGNDGSLVAQRASQPAKPAIEPLEPRSNVALPALVADGGAGADKVLEPSAPMREPTTNTKTDTAQALLDSSSMAIPVSKPFAEKKAPRRENTPHQQPVAATPPAMAVTPTALLPMAPEAVAPTTPLTTLASTPVLAPSAAAPAPVQAPVPVSAPAPAAAAKALAMEDVQPLLAKVVAAMDAGLGEDALDVIDPAWSTRNNRVAFLRGYYQFLQGERPHGVNSVAFRPQNADGVLVVSGVLNLRIVGVFETVSNRDLRLKATFTQHKGKPALTRLEVAETKP